MKIVRYWMVRFFLLGALILAAVFSLLVRNEAIENALLASSAALYAIWIIDTCLSDRETMLGALMLPSLEKDSTTDNRERRHYALMVGVGLYLLTLMWLLDLIP